MTVKQVREALASLPDNMEVFIAERKTEFSYGLVNSISMREINFKESPDDDEVLATDTVVVFDEE